MTAAGPGRRAIARLFAIYAVVTLVPIVALGLVLAATFFNDATARGLAQGRAEATLIAQTAVEPLLGTRPLSGGLSSDEAAGLRRLVVRAVGGRHVLRLRVRDLAGRVQFADDGSGSGRAPDDEAIDAARGAVVARLTRLNDDSNDRGASGVRAVEVYQPLVAGTPARRVGVLELYIPYAPISRAASAGLNRLYAELAIGLAILYLALFAITASVSLRLRREASLNTFLAEYDTLTGLPNRELFGRRAAAAVAEAAESGEPATIAIVDLDRFKDVNDTLGHRSGDQLLAELARRVSVTMRPHETVARLGGDEFGLVLRTADSERVLWRLRAAMEREIEISGMALTASASIGYAIAPEDGDDVGSLVQRADVAMYVAKQHHAGVVRYEASLDQYDAANLALGAELRHAIETEQLVLHYQPQEQLADGQVTAVEALVRWQHPSRGLLLPDSFLALAEQTDLIDKLTQWVLHRALADLASLGPAAGEPRVAINVSARSIGGPSLTGYVTAALEASGVRAERLTIEVTETAIFADPDRAATELTRLRAAGVCISLDDFGRGQTSLRYLSTLPLNELKIDRSFVTDMLGNDAHAAIVRSVIELGHNLGLRVVAEGVETADVLAGLAQAGCDIAQGHLLGRPMALAQLAARLAPAAPAPVGVRA
ncbi:MAG TPA: bifunctional diguanylate cyclase/phosphodiesterase [Solirubrobacteraceae bacterium]